MANAPLLPSSACPGLVMRRIGRQIAVSVLTAAVVAGLAPIGSGATGLLREPAGAIEAPAVPALIGPTGKIVDRFGGEVTIEAAPHRPAVPPTVLTGVLDFPIPGLTPGAAMTVAGAKKPATEPPVVLAAASPAPRRAAPKSPETPRTRLAAPLPPARPAGPSKASTVLAAAAPQPADEPARLLGMSLPSYVPKGAAIVERVAAWTGSITSGIAGAVNGL